MNTPEMYCCGELLVDLIRESSGKWFSGEASIIPHPGGAPANVAVGLSRLGLSTGFIGRTGSDAFGHALRNYLQSAGVETSFLIQDPDHQTRLALVGIDAQGERHFEFYGDTPADSAISVTDCDFNALTHSRIIHFGSLPLTNPFSRDTMKKWQKSVSENNILVSFDPNYRASLWDSDEEARTVLSTFACQSDIVKISLDEGGFLTGHSTPETIAEYFLEFRPQFIAVTLEKEGCYLSSSIAGGVTVPGFEINAIDTTGCGDAFVAGMLYSLGQENRLLKHLTTEDLRSAGEFANAMVAIVASRSGGMRSIPNLVEVRKFLKKAITSKRTKTPKYFRY